MEELYKIVVGHHNMRPKDFWSLTPLEAMWIIDAKKPVKMYGKMTEYEVAEIYRQTYGEPE